MVADRVRAARDRLVPRHAGRTVLVVSHVTPIKLLVRSALDAPARALFRMELEPASLTRVQWWPDGNASLRAFNDTSHLRTLGALTGPSDSRGDQALMPRAGHPGWADSAGGTSWVRARATSAACAMSCGVPPARAAA